MKNLFRIEFISMVIAIISLAKITNANWMNESVYNKLPSQRLEQPSGYGNDDPLPDGITQDWLNSLKDENGNRIYPEDPVTDAMIPKLFNAPSATSHFGISVSDAGDVNADGYSDIIIGASNYLSGTGRAYVYYGGVGMNTTADVTMTGAAVNNLFGISVSAAGDVNGDGYSDVIVGAEGFSSNTGRAYLFYGGTIMNNVADVLLTGEAAGNFFGHSVSSAGDVNGDGFDDLVVGAHKYFSSTGRAYVYYGGSPMNNSADVIMTGDAANDNFGWSVSSAGNVNGDAYHDVIVGAIDSTSTGKAYIYYGSPSMNNAADVTMTGESSGNYFGSSVSDAGDVDDDGYSDVIIGASGYSSGTGRAYVFLGGSSMDNASDVTMSGESAGNQLGVSVTSAGDINGDGYSDVVAGAPGYSSGTGRAFIFLGGEFMDDVHDVVLTGDTVNNFYGYSVSSCGDVDGDRYSEVIVGAYGFSTNIGQVYLYDYYPYGEITNDVSLSGESSSNFFGRSLSNAGDVNGDGYSDIIVGANGYSGNTGRAYVYFGGMSMDNIADVLLNGEANSLFGSSVSGAGDVNGDGFSDVIVGASGYATNTGRAYIFYGGFTMNNVADVIMNGESANHYFGYSVSEAGDVNGDNYSDVIVGAWGHSTPTSYGRAYIFYGNPSMNNTVDRILPGEEVMNNFGISVSCAGDVNGDLFSDVIVGSSNYEINTGKAYIYYGGSLMDAVVDVFMTGEEMGNRFGESVSDAGDVNGDNFSDVIVGAWGNSGIKGRAYIFFGGSVMNNIADVTMTGEFSSSYLGESVSSAGDVNGDGFSDVIVGANNYSSAIGRAYVYFGGSLMNNIADLTMTGSVAGDYLGFCVSGAGDINADGYSDLLVSSDAPPTNNGRANVYLSPTLTTNIKLDLAMFIQGFYNPGSNSQVKDTITAYLRNTTAPYSLVDSCKTTVSVNGVASLKFSNALTGTYYLVVTHRNSIDTWSSSGILLRRTLIPGEYDFSISSSRAYMNNQKQVDTSPVRFAIFNGDENLNGVVNLTDITQVYNKSVIFATGYLSSDMNGDNVVNLADLTITFNNASEFVTVKEP